MPPPLRIVKLADAPAAIPVLRRWFVAEWAPYYGPAGPGDAEADLQGCRNRGSLPIALVAYGAAGTCLGTAALKVRSLDTHRHLGPWLAALLVSCGHRNAGVGATLVAATVELARRLGHDALYVASDPGSTLFREWKLVDTDAPTLRGAVAVYRLNPQAAPPWTGADF